MTTNPLESCCSAEDRSEFQKWQEIKSCWFVAVVVVRLFFKTKLKIGHFFHLPCRGIKNVFSVHSLRFLAIVATIATPALRTLDRAKRNQQG